MRHMDMAHRAGNMAGNSRAAGQAAVPNCWVFWAWWSPAVPWAQILHYLWKPCPFMLCSYCCDLTVLKAVVCHSWTFAPIKQNFLLIWLANGTAVRWQMTSALNRARECPLQIWEPYFRAAADVKEKTTKEPSGAKLEWHTSVILPSKVSTILKNAREKEDLPLPVRPQIPICDAESRWTSGNENTGNGQHLYLTLQMRGWRSCSDSHEPPLLLTGQSTEPAITEFPCPLFVF